MPTPKLDPHYRSIGQQVLTHISNRYGKYWRSCFNDEVSRALIAREVLFITLGAAREDQTGEALEAHARAILNAAETLEGLSEVE